jgi:hypothetical protein
MKNTVTAIPFLKKCTLPIRQMKESEAVRPQQPGGNLNLRLQGRDIFTRP